MRFQDPSHEVPTYDKGARGRLQSFVAFLAAPLGEIEADELDAKSIPIRRYMMASGVRKQTYILHIC
jgi:hypothetical protein